MTETPLTNRELAQTDPVFLKACKLAGVFPSRIQYRKFKYKRGQVWMYWSRHLATRIDKSPEMSVGK